MRPARNAFVPVVAKNNVVSVKSRMWASAALMSIGLAGMTGAQMPGAPVLQNAWAAPGIVVAANIAGGSGSSVYAGAAAWTPASGRFQLSGGAGLQSITGAGGGRAVYGARVAMPLMQAMSGRLGVAAFVGAGGGAGKTGDTTRSNTVIPAGLGVGYRQAIGTAGRGFSAYVDPSYQYHSGAKGSKSYIRFAVGVDIGISARFGLTAGLESGAKAKLGTVGPRGSLYGIGISMKLRS
jgi:hypothetical protein